MAVAADTSWTFEPGAIALLGLLGYLYVRRWREVRASSDGARGAPVARLVAFVTAQLVLVIALLSPIDAISDQLFTIHMVQHVLLLDIAPVFYMLSLTRILLRPVTRRLRTVEESAPVLMHPALAVTAYVSVMWAWHVPALYDAALEHPLLHAGEHVMMLSVGMLYWWHLLSPIRNPMRGGPFGPVVYMGVTKLLVGALGVGITFAPRVLYTFYADGPRLWGLSALADQGVAGAVMAIEQSIVMGIVIAYLFIRALGESDLADERAERFEAERAGTGTP